MVVEFFSPLRYKSLMIVHLKLEEMVSAMSV